MNYNKKTVKDIDVKGKKVLLRCDFNVPQYKATGAITDDKRIRAALPTIQYLLDQGAAVIACSHLGKPKGEWKESLSLAPVAKRLSELLGMDVIFAKDIIGEDAQAKAAALQPGQILLLENTRFEKGETKNDPELAKAMASLAEIYVSDAFGAVHRAHASTAGVAAYLPAVSGFLIQKELEIMGGALANPKRPLVAILGGSKVSSKIGVINNLLDIADTIIIGGGMAYTFSAAQGGKADTAVQSVNGKKGTALTLSAEDVGAVPVSNRKVLANGIAWKSGSILTPDGWDDYSMIRISTNFGSAFIPKLAVNESSGNILVASALPNNYMNLAGFSIARNSTGGSLSIDVSPYALRLAPSGVTALSTELSVYKIEGFA